MGKKIFLVFLLSITFSKAQDCATEVKDIYKNIVKSVGNSFPPPPKLIISEKKRAVAYLNREGITIETAVIDLFCGKKNFEDKIAYVISHELAHHYLSHSWMRNTSLGYVSAIGEFVDNQASSYDQRKLAETSADLFGGFFGQIAGYNVLSYGKEGLEEIYNHYKLPREIKGYPSFDDRINIINSQIDEANKLTTLFNIGNILMMLGKYDEAKLCFEDILKKFTSREIYNNLGLVFLLKAISISDPKISKFVYPLSIDFQTRADISATRSGDLLNDANKLFGYAKEQFNQSIRLDEDYYFAKKNILILEFIQALKDNMENDFLKTENFQFLDQATQVDLEVISGLNQNKSRKKLLKIGKGGSYVTKKNLVYNEEKAKVFTKKDPKQIFDIDISKYIFSGLPKPYKKIKTNYGDLKLTIKDYDKYSLISVERNRKSLYVVKSKIDYNFKGQIKYKNNFYLLLE